MNEKLTAYALNELPPQQRAEFEAEMQQDPALRQEAEEMKLFCEMLNTKVAHADHEVLTPEQRSEVTQAFSAKPVAAGKILRPFWRHPAFVSTAVAASVTLALVSHFQETQMPETLADDFGDLSPSAKLKVLSEADKEAKKRAVGRQDSSTLATAPLAIPGRKTHVENKVLEMESISKAMPAAELADKPADPQMKADHFVDLHEPQIVLPAAGVAKAKEQIARSTGTPMPAERGATTASPVPANSPMLSAVKPSAPLAPPASARPDERLSKAKDVAALAFAIDSPADDVLVRKSETEANTERYTTIHENPFLTVAQQPLSTFSIDVDTASYANVRRFLNNGQRPPADAVRLEELINYFPYSYEAPADGKPFSVQVAMAEAPWNPTHRLARIALKGKDIKQDVGGANFVFLVDVSGSMDEPDKLPLVQQSLKMLVGQLRKDDRVALAVYAGSSGLVLPSTVAGEKETLLQAIENLKAGGSTNGAGGIRLAYEQATQHFIKGGVNRVILCTDGDFNVGVSSPEELEKLITEKAKSGVFLSVLGFGTGNLQDRTMETLADKGNGNYAYIDSLSESRKVLVEQMNGTLVTIAKDVKIQVEFNPAQVAAYRLIGYENRALAKEDFNNDRKDAGEIGAGHTVTALYEIVPAHVKLPDGKPLVDDLKYQGTKATGIEAQSLNQNASSPQAMTVKLRFKTPEGDKSELLEVPVTDQEKKLQDAPRDFQFAVSVAGFGMLLRDSSHAGELTWEKVRELALSGKGEDTLGYRGEFLQLIDKAQGLSSSPR
jgi:secreted protein with Ig-like and vWFA domain